MSFFLKKSLAFLVCYHLATGYSQKPNLDSTIFGRWPSVEDARISNDGNFVSYYAKQNNLSINELVIYDIHTGWTVKREGVYDCAFSKNSRQATFRTKDSLYLMQLGSKETQKAIAIHSMRRPRIEKGEWLAYAPPNFNKRIVLLNILNGIEIQFDSVIDYMWQDLGKALILAIQNGNQTEIRWIDVPEITTKRILLTIDSLPNNSLYATCRFAHSGEQLSFITIHQNDSHSIHQLWCYRRNKDTLLKLADDASNSTGLSILTPVGFSKNDQWLFLKLEKQGSVNHRGITDAAQVDIYSYKDLVLQSQQLKKIDFKPSFMAVVSASGGPLIQLQQGIEGESWIQTNPEFVTGNYIVLSERLKSNFKPWWLTNPSVFTHFLISLKDGKRTLLRKESQYPAYGFSFSPDGKWLVYWDSKQSGFVSYNLRTGTFSNITHKIPKVSKEEDDLNMFSNSMYSQPVDDLIWADSGKASIIYDAYDIWKVDPSGNRNPINLTKGYGAKHHIKLRLIFTNNKTAIVTGFNTLNKQNGFFKISLEYTNNPELLTIGPYKYYRTSSQLPFPQQSFSRETEPVKARDSDTWILSRESSNEYPNYFYTHDWKTFTQFTYFQPQKNYNWLTTKLITWKQFDGTTSQGILYKPENFDKKKKYPVIINYYEHLSYRLYEFPLPGYTQDNINIPWFVSRGYLVFTPDIHFTVASRKGGKTVGEAAYNSVVSAAKYLSTLPYIDDRHLGIQGHSFGGGETNYLITRSNLFSAACSAGGTVSDEVSAYLGPYRPKGGFPNSYRLEHAENGHDMIGATLWARPDLYLRSSPVLKANHITTPLLLMHNEKDEQTDWGQSFEMYTALRRLGKPVWLLQYDNEGHTLAKSQDQKDFTTRLTQFFDYYLKGAKAPVWMTRGISAKLKGIDTGYEMDFSGKRP